MNKLCKVCSFIIAQKNGVCTDCFYNEKRESMQRKEWLYKIWNEPLHEVLPIGNQADLDEHGVNESLLEVS